MNHQTIDGNIFRAVLVRVGEFEELALQCLHSEAIRDSPLVVIDEVGKMECLSKRFQARVRQVVGEVSHHLVVTVPLVREGRQGLALVRELQERGDTELVTVTRENREQVREQLLARLSG